ncbi:MAG: (d)CMP kinase [Candidatus Hydrogenedentes bacterium]|nr:(d)CMP kinase [Candidatus Hydrogenedentota bacterium]
MTDKSDNIIAIDGPAGAGKSTVARRVAVETGFAFLDTGAMYRAVTLRAMRLGVDMNDSEAMARVAVEASIELKWTGTGTRVYLDGDEVTDEIRTPEVTDRIYLADQVPEVRAELVRRQQAFGVEGRVVAEGRDIGTVVYTRARCKIYMVASIDVRAERRYAELIERGIKANLDEVKRSIAERDKKTMTRAVAPLRPAEDAVRLDTTNLSIDEVVAAIMRTARERGVVW